MLPLTGNNGPLKQRSRATSHHASVTHIIYMANRNSPGEHFQTHQDSAGRNELRQCDLVEEMLG